MSVLLGQTASPLLGGSPPWKLNVQFHYYSVKRKTGLIQFKLRSDVSHSVRDRASPRRCPATSRVSASTGRSRSTCAGWRLGRQPCWENTRSLAMDRVVGGYQAEW